MIPHLWYMWAPAVEPWILAWWSIRLRDTRGPLPTCSVADFFVPKPIWEESVDFTSTFWVPLNPFKSHDTPTIPYEIWWNPHENSNLSLLGSRPMAAVWPTIGPDEDTFTVLHVFFVLALARKARSVARLRARKVCQAIFGGNKKKNALL